MGWLHSLDTGSAQISQQEAHGPYRSPESHWPILKDFLFLYACILFCGIYIQFYVMCKGGHCLVTLQAYTCDLGVGISTVLQIIGVFLFKRGRLWDLHTIIGYLTQEYILFRVEDFSRFFFFFFLTYYDTFCLRGDGTTIYRHHLHTIRCYLTQETRIYMG
jgi:hypothetical protein